MERGRKKSRLLPILVTLSAVIAVVIATVWYLSAKASAPAAPQTPAQSAASEQPKPILLELPNASPITPLKEDYNSDSSLWRVVSKDYPLTDGAKYVPNLVAFDLPMRSNITADEKQVRPDTLAATKLLFAAAKAAGYDLILGSGYRSYATQVTLFNSYAAQYGEVAANAFSAHAGQSEHQTGLAMDIATGDMKCYIDTCFADTPAGQWLAAHAYEYGFILRYPKDKTAITKYNFEPWHFRYVGTDLARALHESGLTLDEARPYLEETLTELKAANLIP